MSKLLRKYTQTSLVIRILIGLVIGTILGLLMPSWTGLGILGKMFVGALKGIAPVLVAVLVTSSIAKANKSMGSRFVVLITLYLMCCDGEFHVPDHTATGRGGRDGKYNLLTG